ncbi:efflux RND transporter periplasmic adaptor subunit [Pelomonas sp. KK5]|uniref:efflux RND transporter periplasmic adaptor subunit n=1 Tax=Pelomonas sp. KK5 TaxID=1855730 RepID=UPI00097BCD51|nr:efflux RND transporter periplasmic adaptor subunit [Pelomonas sp. KK5]
MRKQWLIGGIAVLVLAAGGAGVAVFAGKTGGSNKNNSKPADDAKAGPPLEFLASEITQPTLASMPGVIEFSGPLVAPGTVTVRAKATGTLVNLQVGEGSRVKAGQALGQMDLEELRYRIAERSATVESAKAQYEQVERKYKADQGLAANNFIATTALDASRAAMETARAQYLAAKAQLDTSNVTMHQAALISPINGIVAKRLALPGEKLAPEQQILTIVDLSKLELAGLVGTHEVSRLKPGMPVQVKVEGSDHTVEAKISRIAPAAEAGTRSIGVVLALDNPKEEFRAGQYGVARVELVDDSQRLTVPETAITGAAGQEQVWTIANGQLVRRVVTTGRHDERSGRVEIVKGVDNKTQILATRFDNLREGGKANIVVKKATVAASGTASAPARD